MNWGYIFSHGVLIVTLLFFVGSAIYWRSEAHDADDEAEQWEEKYVTLLKAVRDVYYSGHWVSTDLSSEREKELWTRLRNAASLLPGGTSVITWKGGKFI